MGYTCACSKADCRAGEHPGPGRCLKQVGIKVGPNRSCRACELQVTNLAVLNCKFSREQAGLKRFRDQHVLRNLGCTPEAGPDHAFSSSSSHAHTSTPGPLPFTKPMAEDHLKAKVPVAAAAAAPANATGAEKAEEHLKPAVPVSASEPSAPGPAPAPAPAPAAAPCTLEALYRKPKAGNAWLGPNKMKKQRVMTQAPCVPADPGPSQAKLVQKHDPHPISAPAVCGSAHCVHHLWLDLQPSASEPGKPWLSELAMHCLRSWQPLKQVLWVYDLGPAEALSREVPGLHCKNAADVLAPGLVLSLLAGHVPVQLVKDIFSMRALALQGGWWADLDVFWLGRPLPIHDSGYAFVLEPHQRCAKMAFGRAHDRLTLALFALPQGAPLALKLAEDWLTTWLSWAGDHQADPQPFDWAAQRNSTLWMQNTSNFTKSALALRAKLQSLELVHMPLVCLPWTLRCNAEQLDLILSSGVTAGLADQKELDYEKPYKVPSLADVALHGCSVNLWSRQWPKPVQDKLIPGLQRIRLANLAAIFVGPVGPAGPAGLVVCSLEAIADAIEAFSPQVFAHLGRVHGHQLLAFAHHLMAMPWCAKLLSAGGRNVATTTADGGGLPFVVFGVGPWLGPEPDVQIWAALLLWFAVNLNQRDPDLDPLSSLNPNSGADPSCDQLEALRRVFTHAHESLPPRPDGRPQVSVRGLQLWFSTVWNHVTP